MLLSMQEGTWHTIKARLKGGVHGSRVMVNLGQSPVSQGGNDIHPDSAETLLALKALKAVFGGGQGVGGGVCAHAGSAQMLHICCTCHYVAGQCFVIDSINSSCRMGATLPKAAADNVLLPAMALQRCLSCTSATWTALRRRTLLPLRDRLRGCRLHGRAAYLLHLPP